MCKTLGYKLSSEEHSASDLVRYAQMAEDTGFGFALIWARDEATARRTAKEQWPTSAMEGNLSWELPLPEHFEAVAELVTEEQVAKSITCGPDPDAHLSAIRKYAKAGYDHICVHQVGKDQKSFFEFYGTRSCPR